MDRLFISEPEKNKKLAVADLTFSDEDYFQVDSFRHVRGGIMKEMHTDY